MPFTSCLFSTHRRREAQRACCDSYLHRGATYRSIILALFFPVQCCQHHFHSQVHAAANAPSACRYHATDSTLLRSVIVPLSIRGAVSALLGPFAICLGSVHRILAPLTPTSSVCPLPLPIFISLAGVVSTLRRAPQPSRAPTWCVLFPLPPCVGCLFLPLMRPRDAAYSHYLVGSVGPSLWEILPDRSITAAFSPISLALACGLTCFGLLLEFLAVHRTTCEGLHYCDPLSPSIFS